MYLIDSDILIFLGRGRASVQERMSRVGISNCFMSEISVAELYVCVYKGVGQESFVEFLEKSLKVLPISPVLKTFAKLRAQLEGQGNTLEKMDLFIAATALSGEYTLVTHNIRHYARIPGLKLEDWSEES